MTVWIVEHECDDQFYSPYLDTIFSTRELAEAYVASKPEFDRSLYEISECEVKESL